MFAIFFKKNELRTMSLLTKIASQSFVAKSDLIATLETTKTTLNRDINELDTILKKYPDMPQILNHRNHLKLLPGKKNYNINSLLLVVIHLYLQNSYSYQIIQTLVTSKKILLQDFCEKIAISKSYFMQVLANLNDYLKEYHLQIKIKDNTVQFEGPIENIFFFSFLMMDAHTKLFHMHDCHYVKTLQDVETKLAQDINANFNPVNTRKALNLYYQFELYKDELEAMVMTNPDSFDLTKIFEECYPIFDAELPDQYRAYLSFLVNISFTQLRNEEQHIKTLEKLNHHKHPLIIDAAEIANVMLTLIPPLPPSQQTIFKGTIITNFIYLLTFNSELKRPFNNVQLLRDILDEQERHVPVNLKDKLIQQEFKKLNLNNLLPLFFEHLSIFEYVLEIFYWQNAQTKLHIYLDFENSIIFEEHLKNQLNQLFNKDALIFDQTDDSPDIIVSDQLYKTDQAKYFFYYASIQSETLLEELLAFLTKIYFDKRKDNLAAKTKKSTLFI